MDLTSQAAVRQHTHKQTQFYFILLSVFLSFVVVWGTRASRTSKLKIKKIKKTPEFYFLQIFQFVSERSAHVTKRQSERHGRPTPQGWHKKDWLLVRHRRTCRFSEKVGDEAPLSDREGTYKKGGLVVYPFAAWFGKFPLFLFKRRVYRALKKKLRWFCWKVCYIYTQFPRLFTPHLCRTYIRYLVYTYTWNAERRSLSPPCRGEKRKIPSNVYNARLGQG